MKYNGALIITNNYCVIYIKDLETNQYLSVFSLGSFLIRKHLTARLITELLKSNTTTEMTSNNFLNDKSEFDYYKLKRVYCEAIIRMYNV